MSEEQKSLYSWKYDDITQRTPTWYIGALAFSIGLIIWGFFTRQYGMSLVIMLIIWFFYFIENNSDDEVSIDINSLGIRIQNTFYDYSRLSSFTLVYDGNNAIFLRIYTKKKWLNALNLRIDTQIAGDIRPILSNFIQENPKGEMGFLEKIGIYLKL